MRDENAITCWRFQQLSTRFRQYGLMVKATGNRFDIIAKEEGLNSEVQPLFYEVSQLMDTLNGLECCLLGFEVGLALSDKITCEKLSLDPIDVKDFVEVVDEAKNM